MVIPTLEGRQDPSWQFNPQRTLLDASMIAGGQKRFFKLHIIYPKKNENELPGKIYDAPAGQGRGNFAYTGDWELNDKQLNLLEERLRRAIGESGVGVLSGMETYHSEKGVDEFRTDWGPPTAELGIGNFQMPDEIVPVYLIRGLGAYAGGSASGGAGDKWSGSFFTIGDSVIESLAGFEGKTAYELIQNFEDEKGNPEDHANFASYQSQMGTVLHEAFHAVAALPHRTDDENPEGVLGKGMLGDYVDNYLGAHGEEFAKVLDDSIREKAGTDKFAALNLIMNESWNYRWGQPEQIVPDPNPVSAIPTSIQGPLIKTVERTGASIPESSVAQASAAQVPVAQVPSTIPQVVTPREETPPVSIQTGIEPTETVSRISQVSKTPTVKTPNADIVNDMFKATGLTEEAFIELQEREATRRGGTSKTSKTTHTGVQRDISEFTEGPLIQTIPRLRGQ